jgi:hypothetical protein
MASCAHPRVVGQRSRPVLPEGALRVVPELGTRRRSQPAPMHVVWWSLTQSRHPTARYWLELLDDEVDPQIIDSVEPTLVVPVVAVASDFRRQRPARRGWPGCVRGRSRRGRPGRWAWSGCGGSTGSGGAGGAQPRPGAATFVFGTRPAGADLPGAAAERCEGGVGAHRDAGGQRDPKRERRPEDVPDARRSQKLHSLRSRP